MARLFALIIQYLGEGSDPISAVHEAIGQIFPITQNLPDLDHYMESREWLLQDAVCDFVYRSVLCRGVPEGNSLEAAFLAVWNEDRGIVLMDLAHLAGGFMTPGDTASASLAKALYSVPHEDE